MTISRYILILSDEASFYFLTSALQFVVKLKAIAATACVTANVVVASWFTTTVRQMAFIGICGTHKQWRKLWVFYFNKQTSWVEQSFAIVCKYATTFWAMTSVSTSFWNRFINDLLTDASLSRGIYLKSNWTCAPVSPSYVDTLMTAASVVDLTFIDI